MILIHNNKQQKIKEMKKQIGKVYQEMKHNHMVNKHKQGI